MRNCSKKNGFTIIELIIVLAIIALLAAVANFSFSQLSGSQSVDKASLSVYSILTKAHSSAVSGIDASDFGVRIFKNKVTSFEGTYGNSNADYVLSNLVAIATSSGIGTDIIFNNLYGNTTASGTISIYLIANPKTSSTIQIFTTGAIQRN